MNFSKIYIIQGLFLSFLLFNCSADTEKNNTQAELENLPENIRSLENLTAYTPNISPEYSIRFTEKAVFKDSLGIGTMGNFAVDKMGNVYVAHGGLMKANQTIHIYREDGSYFKYIGRTGSGPGDFRSLSQIQINSGLLYVYDHALQRISIFDLNALELIKIILLNPESWENIAQLKGTSPSNFFARDDSTILLGFKESYTVENSAERKRHFYLMNWDGDIISDKIFEYKDVNFYVGTGVPGPQLDSSPVLPFMRHALTAVSENGQIYSAWSEDFLIKVFDSKGNYQRAFYHDYPKSNLDKSSILSLHEHSSTRLKNSIRTMDFPDTWPALSTIILDDANRLWVSTFIDDNDQYAWWVLSHDGRLLAKFNWPGRKLYRMREEIEVKAVKNDHLYAVKTNAKTGIQKIVKYKIVME